MAAKHIVRIALVMAFVVGTVALGAAQQGDPRISPRDQVTIEVFGIEQLNGRFRVDADGHISFPPLEKPVKAAGLTVRELEAELGRRLRDEGWLTVTPKITAELEQTPNKHVMVDGEVRNPGRVAYAGELTVLEALMRAGSTTESAADVALIVRAANLTSGEQPPILEVSLRDLRAGNVEARNVVLQDGDLLHVRKAEQVYISGHVARPGAYPVTPGMTLKQVITLAGGITERGSEGKIEIRRGDQKVKDVKYATTKVLPGDTITVKARIW